MNLIRLSSTLEKKDGLIWKLYQTSIYVSNKQADLISFEQNELILLIGIFLNIFLV